MNRLTQNVVSIVVGDAGRRLLGFFAIAYLARHVGLAEFGLINIGFTVLSYAMVVSSGGLGAFAARTIAKDKSDEIVSTIVGIRFVTSLVAFLVIVIVAALFIPQERSAEIIVIFSLSLFAYAFLLDWYFQGKEEMHSITVSRLVSALVYLVLLLWFVHSPEDVVWVALAAVAGDAVAAIISITWFQRKTKTRLSLSLKGGIRIFLRAFPIGVGTILAHLTINLPTLVLGIMLTNVEVGIYSAANKLVFFLLMFDRILATVLLPASSRFYAQTPEKLAYVLGIALKWIARLALPICVGGTILAEQIVVLIFGPEYHSASIIFQILIWFIFMTMLHTVYTSGLIAAGGEKLYGKAMIVSAVLYSVSVIVCAFFYGTAGVAVAVVVSECCTVLLMKNYCDRYVRFSIDRTVAYAAVSTIVMVGVLFLLPPFHPFVTICIGATVYAILLFSTKGVTMSDFAIFRNRVA